MERNEENFSYSCACGYKAETLEELDAHLRAMIDAGTDQKCKEKPSIPTIKYIAVVQEFGSSDPDFFTFKTKLNITDVEFWDVIEKEFGYQSTAVLIEATEEKIKELKEALRSVESNDLQILEYPFEVE